MRLARPTIWWPRGGWWCGYQQQNNISLLKYSLQAAVSYQKHSTAIELWNHIIKHIKDKIDAKAKLNRWEAIES